MFIDPKVDPRPEPLVHNPFKALVSPRPIGWITTMSAAGELNLAPFSYFNAVCDDPHCVMYCPNGNHPEGGVKDSLKNVEATGEFVCNLSTWNLREEMNATSAHMPRGVDEMAKVGLTAVSSVKVKPPRVKESPAHLECRYLQTVKLPSNRDGHGNYMVLGEVVAIHIDEAIIKDGRVDMLAMKPIARLGYMDYCAVDNVFSMVRPD